MILPAARLSAQSGPTPELFAPGIVSTEAQETSSTFTPDGKAVYFTRSDLQFTDNTILESHLLKNGQWSKPEVASFSGVWRDAEPHVSPDGTKLFFESNRPATPDGKPILTPRGNPGGNIWYVNKVGDRWSEPVHIDGPVNALPTVYNPSTASSGDLYFSGNLPAGGAKNQIYMAKIDSGHYAAPVLMSFSDPKWNNLDPWVSPDESFIIFVSDRNGGFKIHITYKKGDQWSDPRVLSESIESKNGGDVAPSLARDGHTLYFTSSRRPDYTFPKQKEDFAAVDARLHRIENGSRNIWRVDITDLLKAGEK